MVSALTAALILVVDIQEPPASVKREKLEAIGKVSLHSNAPETPVSNETLPKTKTLSATLTQFKSETVPKDEILVTLVYVGV